MHANVPVLETRPLMAFRRLARKMKMLMESNERQYRNEPLHVQLSLSSWYPALQEHLYPPSLFSHCWLQHEVFALHSFTS